MSNDQVMSWLIKPAVFVLCLVPLVFFSFDVYTENLSADPVKDATLFTGDWILRFLLITLLITPLRKLTGWSRLLRLRRMLGLYAFFYACLHFLVWFWLDRELQLGDVIEDIIKRPYITVGFSAFVMLIPLAVTSNKFSIRRLKQRWQKLHKLVYLISGLGILHFLWLVKADVQEPVIYGVILIFLLGIRVWWDRQARAAQSI